MKILMVTSEALPYAKTGGLADMVSSLSIALAKLGHDVRIVIPRYYPIDKTSLTPLPGALGVPMGGIEEWSAVYEERLPGSTAKKPVQVYFIDHEIYFGRDGIYGIPSQPDFIDNPRRFSFFCKAAFQLCRKIEWYPDVVHAHDWPAAMATVYQKFAERAPVAGGQIPGGFERAVSILTIHNLGYQGVYSKANFDYTGLGWDVYFRANFDDWDMMNFLKAGIFNADKLNTVSPNYAEETKTQAQGFRLDGDLRQRSKDYLGILNGIDTSIWNPAKDKYLGEKFSVENMAGKAKAKAALQKYFGLEVNPKVPVIGMITRLAGQKGVGELFGPNYGSAFSFCRDFALQFVLLGSGESWCEKEVAGLSARLTNFRAQIGYSEELSHLIEAGSDFFLMPSRYEPCGLNQMYSLAYGTLPIVRRTGGLVDTVENYDEKTGSGTGFMFDILDPSSIYNTIGWAMHAWYNLPEHIAEMRIRAMKQDFSWEKSAKKYVEMYQSAISALPAAGA
ncbi:MAG: glycogen synthase [Spirochaetes bacterium]|nr:glycogen synthase [Spirochaetota bacterium]